MMDEKTQLLRQIVINQTAMLMYLEETAQKDDMKCLRAIRHAIELDNYLITG